MLYGIDVSKHNGTVDWKKVKSAGKDFAFIRLGWAGYDGRIEANGGLDPMFHANVKGALDAGLNVGVYVYSYAKTPTAAIVAAKETLKLVKPYRLTYPIAFDIEDSMYQSMGKAINTEIAKAFLSTVEEAKYYGILYTYKNFAESYLDMNQLSRFDLWIAQYGSKCTYQGKYGIWQYAGNDGRCAGVSGACDLNIAYKDYPQIIKSAQLNRLGSITCEDYDKLMEQYDALYADFKKLQVDYEELARLHDAQADKLNQIISDIEALVKKYRA